MTSITKDQLGQLLAIGDKRQRAKEIARAMASPDFWQDRARAQGLTQELGQIQSVLETFDRAETPEGLRALEKLTLLTGEYDGFPAILEIHAGSGGTEAQDWAEMLLRMYLRYAQRQAMMAKVLDLSPGEEAGIKSTTVEIEGVYPYGYLKGEAGVHRLVRMSPFDADRARHTSFALVQVIPKLPRSNVTIDPKDLRVEVFRSRGKGGQGVNTTDSAVRLTHLPTGITASVQNERSQLQNKATALAILHSRLELLDREQSAEQAALLKGEYHQAAWGNQIRSYVLAPYQLVKDHRTDHQSSNPQAVLDGEIEEFIEATLRYFKEKEARP